MSKSIRGLLALAVSTSLVLAQGDKPAATSGGAGGAGWSATPGKGLKYDGGEAFGLELKNRLQVHWTFESNEDAEDVNTFDIRRARTSLAGHVFSKHILYFLQMEWTDDGGSQGGALKQGWAQWNFSHSEQSTIGLRAGQAKTMFGYEATTTSAGLWFVERSIASRAFADAYTRGAWLNGLMAENRLRWAFGAMNTDSSAAMTGNVDVGEEVSNSDNELSYVLAANFDPMGDFHDGKQTVEGKRQGDWRTDDQSLKGTIGAAVAIGNGRTAAGPGGADIDTLAINLNTAWTVSKFNILGEYFMRADEVDGSGDEEEPSGFAVGAGYLLDKSGDSAIQWGLGLRASMAEGDAGPVGGATFFPDAEVTEITAVVNAFYHGHPCKTQLEWTLQEVDPAGAASSSTNHIFRVAFQLEF